MNRSSSIDDSALPAIDHLSRAIAVLAQTDGDYATAVPALTLHRRNRPTEPLHCIFNLGLGVVAQGSKQLLLGDEVIKYGPGQSVLTSIAVPVVSHVTRATADKPMLGLLLTLDSQEVIHMVAEMQLPAPTRQTASRSICIETLDASLLADLVRLVELLGQPTLAPLLAPLIKREITIRLLAGPHGPQLQRLAADGSPSQQITKATAWIKNNFSKPMEVDALAAHVHMSASTFRQHFRTITGTSPVQYQKQLRLQEARQLMLNQNIDAASASGLVGYESASQFSREYSRLFGAPPLQDVRRLRNEDRAPERPPAG